MRAGLRVGAPERDGRLNRPHHRYVPSMTRQDDREEHRERQQPVRPPPRGAGFTVTSSTVADGAAWSRRAVLRHVRGPRRQGRLPAAVLERRARRHQELRRHRVRPRRPHPVRLLALGGRRHPGHRHRAARGRRRRHRLRPARGRVPAAQRRRGRTLHRRRPARRPRRAPLLHRRPRPRRRVTSASRPTPPRPSSASRCSATSSVARSSPPPPRSRPDCGGASSAPLALAAGPAAAAAAGPV